jgi:outer membrane protein assembly factor BamB
MRIIILFLFLHSPDLIVAQQNSVSPLFSRVVQGDNNIYDSKAWTLNTGAPVRATPLAKGLYLFVGNAKGDFLCIDKKTGSVAWRFSTGKAIHSSAVSNGGKIYFSDNSQVVYALNEKTGKLLWKFEMGKKLAYPWRYDYYHASPVIDDGRLLIGGDDGFFYALDPASGKLLWRFKAKGIIRSTAAVYRDQVIFGDTEATLYTLRAKTGILVREYRINGDSMRNEDYGFDRRAITSSPVVKDNSVIFGARDGFLYCLDAVTGKENWKMDHNVSWVISTVAIKDTMVVTGTSDGRFVQAVHLSTGKEIWRFRTPLAVWASPLIIGKYVYAGSFDGQLYGIDIATGTRVSQFKTNGKILSSPIWDDRLLYFGSDDGCLYAISGHEDQRQFPSGQEKYVFYETGVNVYFRHNTDIGIRNYLRGQGYKVVGADSIAHFLSNSQKRPSVIVFASCYFPASIIRDGKNSPVRKYLDAGGRIVLIGINPILYKVDPASKQAVAFNPLAADSIFNLDYGEGDTRTFQGDFPVFPEGKGIEIGLPDFWSSSVFIDEKQVDIVLGRNENGEVSAFVKKYNNNGQLVQLWMDTEKPDRLDAILKASEWKFF